MKDRFLIVVEGIADETFIRQNLYHLFSKNAEVFNGIIFKKISSLILALLL